MTFSGAETALQAEGVSMMRKISKTLAGTASLALLAGSPASAESIGVSYQNLAFPYVAALKKAAENACKALGVECVETDAVNDTNKELANVESMLAKGIVCLAFEAASLDASVASIQAANKKGVPVVQFNGKASGGDYVTFVGSEQTARRRPVADRLGVSISGLWASNPVVPSG